MPVRTEEHKDHQAAVAAAERPHREHSSCTVVLVPVHPLAAAAVAVTTAVAVEGTVAVAVAVVVAGRSTGGNRMVEHWLENLLDQSGTVVDSWRR